MRRRPFCCYSRLGKAKASYPSEEAAEAARVLAEKHHGDHLETYQCRVNAGRWHIRKVRAEAREAVPA